MKSSQAKMRAAERQPRRQFLVIQAERLEKTRRAVAQMQREQKQAEDIKGGDVNVLKSVNHHGINVVMIERIVFEQREARIDTAHGKMQRDEK